MKLKVHCNQHDNHGITPRMIQAGLTPLGTKTYICAVCGSVREFGQSQVLNLLNGYGFILSNAGNIFFHFSDLNGYTPAVGDNVVFEVIYFDDGKKKAVNIKPITEEQEAQYDNR